MINSLKKYVTPSSVVLGVSTPYHLTSGSITIALSTSIEFNS